MSEISQTILRRDDVERATGLSRSTIYFMVSKGTFPKPVPLGGKAVGWVQSEVSEWIEARIAERDQPKTKEAA